MVSFCYLLLFLCLKLPSTLFICMELIYKSHFQSHRSLRAFWSMTFQMSMILADNTKEYVMKRFRGPRSSLPWQGKHSANRLRGSLWDVVMGCICFSYTHLRAKKKSFCEGENKQVRRDTEICSHMFGINGRGKLTKKRMGWQKKKRRMVKEKQKGSLYVFTPYFYSWKIVHKVVYLQY